MEIRGTITLGTSIKFLENAKAIFTQIITTITTKKYFTRLGTGSIVTTI